MRVGFGQTTYGLVILAVLASVFSCPCAWAVDYFVDATNGRDTASGTSAEAAWQSLTKVSGFAFAAGDRIFFKRGETWRGLLRISRSGTAVAPIKYGVYGSGAAPTINGAQSVTAWSDAGTNLYKATINSRVEQVFIDGVRGTQESNVAALDAPGEWHWASNVLTLYSTKVPSGVEASADTFTILVNSAQHVQISGLRVIRGLYPVWLQNTANIGLTELIVEDGAGYAGIFVTPLVAGRGSLTTILQCTVTGMVGNSASRANGNDGSGIQIYGNGIGGKNSIVENVVHDNKHEGILLAETSDNLVRGNIVYNHGGSGIRAGLPSTSNNVIEFNTVYSNALTTDDRFGIDLIYVGNNNTVRYNTVHSQGSIPGGLYLSGGIRFDGNDGSGTVLTESTGNTAYYNVVYDEFTGINVFSFSNVSLYNNTIAATKQYGIAANAPDGVTPVNTVIKNNIVSTASGSVLAHVNLLNSDIDYNCYSFGPGSTFIWGFQFLTHAAYLAQSGQDTHSLAADPLFHNASAHDYRLQALSPVRDAGLNVGLPLDHNGVLVPQDAGTDIGAYEYVFIPEPEGEGTTEGEVIIEGEGIAEGDGGVEGEGTPEGEGIAEGNLDGEGIVEGTSEGQLEGNVEGSGEGMPEGIAEGSLEGTLEGIMEGDFDGEGIAEGVTEGAQEGTGDVDGEGVAEGEEEAELTGDFDFDFSASVTDGDAPLPVRFAAEARKQAKSHYPFWAWDFGDGNFAWGSDVSHVYHEPGIYTVTLSVITENNVEDIVKPQLIAVNSTVPASSPVGRAFLVLLLLVSFAAGRGLTRRRFE